ncbi:MAG: hypothetical protein ACK5MZ_06865 [Aestuariibaculum sp.]
MNRKIKKCDECESEYYSNTSEMDALCPNCAFYLYGYNNCEHSLEKGKCIKCFWDGSISKFIKILMKRRKNLSVSYNWEDIPHIPYQKKSYLTFGVSKNKRTIEIIGNKIGLKLMAKALLGIAETERDDDYHIHIDDLYKINEENKEFIIRKIKRTYNNDYK